MKKYFFALMLLCSSSLLMAQNPVDSTFLIQNLIGEVLHYGLFVLGLYELVIRFFPTVKSYSLLAQVIAILQLLIPDRSTEGGVHTLMAQSLTAQNIAVGDTVKLSTGELGKVIDTNSDSWYTIQTKTAIKDIPLENIIEVVKTGYTLINAVKSIVSFIKALFKKS